MADFLHSTYPRLRATAACALRNIGTLESVVPLTGVLNDPDSQVRLYAVSGLCFFTEACKGQKVYDYMRPENRAAFLALLRKANLLQ